jgi:hypothetical protein
MSARFPVIALVVLATVTGLAPRARAQEVEQPDVAFFDPLVTRKPNLEREMEVTAAYEKGREGQEVEVEAELAWRSGRLEVSLEAPFVFLFPKESPDVAGFGDLTLGGKVLLFQSPEHAFAASAGFELGLPSGSERRGLGGSTTATPYISVGKAFGPIDVLADVSYGWTVDGADSGAETLGANLAAAYRGWRHVTPFLELNMVTQTRSGNGAGSVQVDQDQDQDEDDDDAAGGNGHESERSLVGRVQLYLTPGVGFDGIPLLPRGSSVRAGVQIPLTDAKEFDYRVLVVFNWEF